MAHPWVTFYIGLYSEKSSCLNPYGLVLIFGMKHHLVNLYQVCSNYIPGAKNGPPSGSHVLHRPIYKKKKIEKSSCLKP